MKSRGNFLNLIKHIYYLPTANIVLKGQKLEVFLLRPITSQGGPPLTTAFQHHIGSTS